MMKPRHLSLIAMAAAGLAAAAVAASALLAPLHVQAQAPASTPPCVCSAPTEVATGHLPTSPRASITHCQCGAQSCAVLNSQVLQCSK